MPQIPAIPSLDSSLALLADPYRFISRNCDRLGSDVIEARLLLQRTICIRGEEAARLFYESGRFTREGAVPKVVQKTLFGTGGVQTLKGERHRRRKALLMSVMTPDRVSELTLIAATLLEDYAARWPTEERVVVYHEFRRLLTEAVCHWAGVALAAEEAETRARQLAAMYEEAATPGLGQLRGRAARQACESWVGRQLGEIRVGRREVAPDSAAYKLAMGEEEGGTLIDLHAATVDMLSIMRPTVAVSVFITFAAHALHTYPQSREALLGGDDLSLRCFAQEVRRFYPFFPMAAAVVREPFDWQGYHFPKGRRVVLDLYGTNHHAGAWEAPDEFRPERFRDWDESRNSLVAQGGGRQETNHRCVGEALTIELMKVAADFLVNKVTYTVPAQDLQLDMQRMPALPPSGMELTGVNLQATATLQHEIFPGV